ADTVNCHAGLLAQIDLIRVKAEYFLLRKPRFENDRHIRFGDLSFPRRIVRQQQILYKLLCDRRSALIRKRRILVSLVAAPKRSRYTAKVNPVMFEKCPVLGYRYC